MTSSGVQPRSAAMSATLRSTSSGCASLSATASESKFNGRPPPDPAARSRHVPATRDRGTPPCVRRSGRSISSRNASRMLNVNGSRRFIWNTSGRHETCGHTSTPSARAAVFASMIFSCHGKPLTVSSAVHVSGRPMPRWMSYTSACVIFSPGSSAATPLSASRSGSSSARQLVEAGDARRHRAAAVAVVRRRRRRREPGGARGERLGDHLLHAADLVVGRVALVAVASPIT